MSQNTTDSYPDRNPGSSIVKRLMTSKYMVISISPFKPLIHNIEWDILAFNETVLVALRNPVLCTPKLVTQTLRLSCKLP